MAFGEAHEAQEFVVTMLDYWEQAREEGLKEGRSEGRSEGLNEGLTKGRSEGLNEGRSEGAARALLAVLRARGIVVPTAARKRILTQKDPKRLERWLQKAAVATSIVDVLDAS